MDAVPVTTEYVAPSSNKEPACPSEAEFWAAFSSRAEHAVRADAGEWTLIVRLDRFQKGRFTGTLRVLHGKALELERSLDDDSCKDLATALAVVAAITVESAPRKPPPLPDPPVSDSVLSGVIDVPPPVLPEERVHLRAGVGPEATSFLSPVASAGIAAFVEAEAPGSRFFALRARLGGHFATSFPFTVSPGGGVASATANVSCGFVRVELGGLRLRFARALALRLAAISDLGALVVEGRETQKTVTAPFVDVGAMLRFAWETPVFFVEIGGGGVATLTRPIFHFDTFSGAQARIFEVPEAGAMGEVGVGVRFF